MHGIIVIVGATPRGCPGGFGQARGPAPTGNVGNTGTLSLGDVVHRFKTMTTKRHTDGVKQSGWQSFPGKLWQRNYWEHIIRDEMELNRIREYIHTNPTQWEFDRLNVADKETVRPTPVIFISTPTVL
jgi:putative transposase